MKLLIVVLVLIFIGLQYRLWVGDGSFADIDRLEQQVSAQQAENSELEQRNTILVNEVKELQSGMDAIEEHARNELGLIRDGETFVLILEDEPDSSGMPTDILADEEPESLPNNQP